MVQARAAGTFTSAHEAFWAVARRAHGDGGGAQALVEVLLLHRHHAHEDVVAGITAGLPLGAVSSGRIARAVYAQLSVTTGMAPTADWPAAGQGDAVRSPARAYQVEGRELMLPVVG